MQMDEDTPKYDAVVVSVEYLIERQIVGKRLIGLEFGANEGAGSRSVSFGQVITDCYMGADSDCDAVLRIVLEDGSETYAYSNEDITVANARPSEQRGV